MLSAFLEVLVILLRVIKCNDFNFILMLHIIKNLVQLGSKIKIFFVSESHKPHYKAVCRLNDAVLIFIQ